jgi:mitogen-activated protein kinase 1/3
MVFDDVYVVMEFMETDLYKIIYSKNELSDEHIQYFIYQILCGLKYIHGAGVIHRDLKPSNLLVNGNCDLKICDFGLARGVSAEEDYDLTEYVVTRWYRAPEIMCACSDYDNKIDVWAVGCIMAELLGRGPLFPGDDYIKQVNLIFDTLGTPDESDMKFISNQKAYQYIKSLKPRPKVPFSTKYKHASAQAIDLLDKMLAFNPAKRLTVDQCLEHPYLQSIRNKAFEKPCNTKFDFSFEREEMTRFNLRKNMWKEILRQHPEATEQFNTWQQTAKTTTDEA